MTTLKEAAAIMSAAGKAKPSEKRTAHCRRMAKRPRKSAYVCAACGHRQSSKWMKAHAAYNPLYIPCIKCGAKAMIFKPKK